MAGRGCIINIQVRKDVSASGELQIENMRLAVALHTHIEVLMEQLQQATSIPMDQQVLILLDLTDPDRNSDILLDTANIDPRTSLRDLHIRNGFVLSLHSLGIATSNNNENSIQNAKESEPEYVINTIVQPRQADHSFNGVIFNITSTGPYEITIKSFWLAGMLGRIRIFSRDRGWDARQPDEYPTYSGHWWAYRENVSRVGWQVVADQICPPSWDKVVEIRLHTPVTLLPHETLGFYCHSNLPDDLGIQYQSFSKETIVAEDEYLRITPGVGHTGSIPFDEVNGWYRAFRGPAGSFSYTCKLKGWNIWSNLIFPTHFKDAVKQVLLVNNRVFDDNHLCKLPPFVIYYIMEFAHWDWFTDGQLKRKLLGDNNERSKRSTVEVLDDVGVFYDEEAEYSENNDDDSEYDVDDHLDGDDDHEDDYEEDEEDEDYEEEEIGHDDNNFAIIYGVDPNNFHSDDEDDDDDESDESGGEESMVDEEEYYMAEDGVYHPAITQSSQLSADAELLAVEDRLSVEEEEEDVFDTPRGEDADAGAGAGAGEE